MTDAPRSRLDEIEARLNSLSEWDEGPLPSKAQIAHLLAIARAAERWLDADNPTIKRIEELALRQRLRDNE